MAEDLGAILKQKQKDNEANKNELIRIEERINNLRIEKDKLLSELAILGIKEENLVTEIEKLEAEIRIELDKCKD